MRTKRHNAPVKKPKPRGKPKAAKKRVVVSPAQAAAAKKDWEAAVKEDAVPAILTFERLHPAPVVETEEAPVPAESKWWRWRL